MRLLIGRQRAGRLSACIRSRPRRRSALTGQPSDLEHRPADRHHSAHGRAFRQHHQEPGHRHLFRCLLRRVLRPDPEIRRLRRDLIVEGAATEPVHAGDRRRPGGDAPAQAPVGQDHPGGDRSASAREYGPGRQSLVIGPPGEKQSQHRRHLQRNPRPGARRRGRGDGLEEPQGHRRARAAARCRAPTASATTAPCSWPAAPCACPARSPA